MEKGHKKEGIRQCVTKMTGICLLLLSSCIIIFERWLIPCITELGVLESSRSFNIGVMVSASVTGFVIKDNRPQVHVYGSPGSLLSNCISFQSIVQSSSEYEDMLPILPFPQFS